MPRKSRKNKTNEADEASEGIISSDGEDSEVTFSETENEQNDDYDTTAEDVQEEQETTVMEIAESEPSHSGESVRKKAKPNQRIKSSKRKGTDHMTEEVNVTENHGPDEDGTPGGFYKALKEMTSQVLSAIKGMTTRPRDQTTPKPKGTKTRARPLRRIEYHHRSSSSSSSSDEEIKSESDDCSSASIATDKICRPKPTTIRTVKLPPFTGDERWEVWFNRFTAVADMRHWDDATKLAEMVPQLQGKAGEFAFGQLQSSTLKSFKRLTKEMKSRFGEIKRTKTYAMQFNRRNQQSNESVEEYAAELKRLFDRAYPHRDAATRQEDLVARFLLGISDDKARVHVELNKEPKTIDQAVYHAVNYIEATQRVNFRDDGSKPPKPVRQTKDHQKSPGTKRNNAGHRGGKGGNSNVHENTQQGQRNHTNGDSITLSKGELQQLIQDAVAAQIGGYHAQGGYQPISSESGKQRRDVICFKCRGSGHYARDCRNQPYDDNWAYVNNFASTNIGNGPNSGMHDRQQSNLSPSAASFYPQRGENVAGPSQASAGDLTNSKQNSSN